MVPHFLSWAWSVTPFPFIQKSPVYQSHTVCLIAVPGPEATEASQGSNHLTTPTLLQWNMQEAQQDTAIAVHKEVLLTFLRLRHLKKDLLKSKTGMAEYQWCVVPISRSKKKKIILEEMWIYFKLT